MDLDTEQTQPIEIPGSPEVLEGSDFDLGGNPPSSKYAYERAERENLAIVLPKPNELLVDIDNEDAENVFNTLLPLVAEYIGLISVERNPSKSGHPRYHLTVTLGRDVTPLERIALQAILGSDRKRELLSFIEMTNGDQTPTLFLELKKEISI